MPVIHTLLLTVLCLTVERWLALKTAFGKKNLTKFVANIKAALKANDFDKAEKLCNEMRGSVSLLFTLTRIWRAVLTQL